MHEGAQRGTSMSGKRYGINCIGPDCACGAPDAAELMVMRRRMMSEMSQTQFQGKAETFAWNRKLNARHDGLIRAAVLRSRSFANRGRARLLLRMLLRLWAAQDAKK